ncbi:Heme chaperone CcmE [Bosea sp. LC85]|nr:Heme chaperone CcmE [Bosea sp. LC85]
MTATQPSRVVAPRRGMSRKQRRLALIGAAGAVLCLAAGLVLFAMRDTIVFFYGPTEITEKGLQPGTRMRLGGLVETGSVSRGPGQRVTFAITDSKTTVQVSYDGLLPDLFREGQGVVTEGVLEAAGRFRADSVLAKHDETYMPREVADALKKQGHWQPGDAGAQKPQR